MYLDTLPEVGGCCHTGEGEESVESNGGAGGGGRVGNTGESVFLNALKGKRMERFKKGKALRVSQKKIFLRNIIFG